MREPSRTDEPTAYKSVSTTTVDNTRTPEFQRLHVQLCRIAAIEMDWMQRLHTGDEAMREISKILTGKR